MHDIDETMHWIILATVLAAMFFALKDVSAGGCQALRNNLWNAGMEPGYIADRVGECIINHEKLKVRVLRDPEEIRRFREEASTRHNGGLVEKQEKTDER